MWAVTYWRTHSSRKFCWNPSRRKAQRLSLFLTVLEQYKVAGITNKRLIILKYKYTNFKMFASVSRAAGRAAFYRLQNQQLLRHATKQANSFKRLPRQVRYNKLPWRGNTFALTNKSTRPTFQKIAIVSTLTAGAGVCAHAYLSQDDGEVMI